MSATNSHTIINALMSKLYNYTNTNPNAKDNLVVYVTQSQAQASSNTSGGGRQIKRSLPKSSESSGCYNCGDCNTKNGNGTCNYCVCSNHSGSTCYSCSNSSSHGGYNLNESWYMWCESDNCSCGTPYVYIVPFTNVFLKLTSSTSGEAKEDLLTKIMGWYFSLKNKSHMTVSKTNPNLGYQTITVNSSVFNGMIITAKSGKNSAGCYYTPQFNACSTSQNSGSNCNGRELPAPVKYNGSDAKTCSQCPTN